MTLLIHAYEQVVLKEKKYLSKVRTILLNSPMVIMAILVVGVFSIGDFNVIG